MATQTGLQYKLVCDAYIVKGLGRRAGTEIGDWEQ